MLVLLKKYNQDRVKTYLSLRQQQLKMAKYMEEIFGDLLLKDFLKEYPMKKGN